MVGRHASARRCEAQVCKAHRRTRTNEQFRYPIRGGPIGYIQTYRIADYPEYAQHLAASANAAGVDLFIGDATRVGRGTGTRALVKFLRTIVFADESIDECILGPETRNSRAIRCYEKVGFRYWKTVQIPGERAPEYLMRITPRGLAQG